MKTLETRLQIAAAFRSTHAAYEPNYRTTLWHPVTGEFRSGLFLPRDHVLEEAKREEKVIFDQTPLSRKESLRLVRTVQKEGIARDVLTAVSTRVDELTKETPFHEVDEYQTSFPLSEKWNKPCIINGSKAVGIYFRIADGGYIHNTRKKPTPTQELQALATTGRRPTAQQIRIHEKAHAMQDDLAKRRKIPGELHEVQAYRVEETAPTNAKPEILVALLTNSPIYPNFTERKVKSAVWSIDRLQALGLTQRDITNLTKETGAWNNRFGGWKNVDEAIEETKKKRGMDDGDLEREVMKANIVAGTVFLKVRASVQNVLVDIFADELFPESRTLRGAYTL